MESYVNREMLGPHRRDDEAIDMNGNHDAKNKTPMKRRSLSDCSVGPSLSPSPKFREPVKRISQDDIHLDSPSTPRRSSLLVRDLSACLPARSSALAQNNLESVSPKLNQPKDIYASPTSAIPRRSRGMDFSRAATNLHHSTLAEQPSPESSPVMIGRAINIPQRRSGPLSYNNEIVNGAAGSLWSSMATAERSAISSSVGSVNMVEESTSSSSDDEDLMDADEIDNAMITTPQMISAPFGTAPESPALWSSAPSPAINGFMNIQRHKMRVGKERKNRSNLQHSHMTRSPPTTRREMSGGGSMQRRDSISWAAKQLHISGSESDDNHGRRQSENDASPSTPNRDGQRGVVKRVVTRRGNMLPKPKGFARIRAALAEEGAPIENETRREADVIRQVREADPVEELETNQPPSTTTHSSPIFGPALSEALDDIPESDFMSMNDQSSAESAVKALNFRQQLMKNSTAYWNAQEDHYKITPPQNYRAPGSCTSEDTNMDSPSLNNALMASMPSIERTDTMSSSGQSSGRHPSLSASNMPSAAEITRKVNNKRRRDDDFDPSSFKRRAVSPGMSVHNSPVLQSPMQKDTNPWGRSSVSGDAKTCDVAQHKGSLGGGNGGLPLKRIGLQGMVDTHDSLMKMSIE